MMLWWLLSVPTLGLAAVPSPVSSSLEARQTSNACGSVSRLVRSAIAANATARVPGTLALSCLRSVPNKIAQAQQLVKSVKAFAQWQSTHAWLKDPPEGYEFPPVDILKSLDSISATLSAGGYASEYDFQLSMMNTITLAHDGHFSYIGDVFKVFTFGNDFASDIVSVSTNGTALPKMYRLSALQNRDTSPPAITKINNLDVTDFMVKVAMNLGLEQDIDAQYNAMLPNHVHPFSPSLFSPWAFGQSWLGAKMTFTYEDGTSDSSDTNALLNPGVDFTNIITGEDFYNAFCLPSPPLDPGLLTGTGSLKPSLRPTVNPRKIISRQLPTRPKGPTPIVQDSEEGAVKGFFLDGPGFDDVAVLSISAFESGNDTLKFISDFQKTVESFLSKSRAAKKQRLVIDLTSNGGGLVFTGFELFAQLFPGQNQFTANDMRLTDSISNMSAVFEALPEKQKEQFAASGILSNLTPLSGLKMPSGDNVTSASQVMTPVTLKDDKFTGYIGEVDFGDEGGIFLSGTGNRSNLPPAAFKPENVVLLTDGNCASTCTVFSYLMFFQMNTKTVTVGGRPQAAPIQSIGGTEGAQVLTFSEISLTANVTMESITDKAKLQQLQGSELDILAEGYAVRRSAQPESGGTVNFKNSFAPSDSKTPLQFTSEPANCRFFYTNPMINSPELVWQYAVNATWTNPDKYCVQGSRVPVNMQKALDPAFEAMTNNTGSGGNGNGGANGTPGNGNAAPSGTGNNGAPAPSDGSAPANGDGGKDEKKNAADGAFKQGSVRAACLLAAVSLIALNL
ncbi:hypothetical protein F5Y04DRAFT_276747 [Hypomontagnella monticulosa]|nr:hypothetical protein F5Y04DRAFT_276747 [Hypomontagnella monticulosa]